MLQNLLTQGGIPEQYIGTTVIVIKIIVLLILCWVVNVIAKKTVLRLIRALIRKTKNDWDDVFVDKQVFKNVSHFAPAFVIYFLLRYGSKPLQRLLMLSGVWRMPI